jgi:hypothetical protein
VTDEEYFQHCCARENIDPTALPEYCEQCKEKLIYFDNKQDINLLPYCDKCQKANGWGYTYCDEWGDCNGTDCYFYNYCHYEWKT